MSRKTMGVLSRYRVVVQRRACYRISLEELTLRFSALRRSPVIFYRINLVDRILYLYDSLQSSRMARLLSVIDPIWLVNEVIVDRSLFALGPSICRHGIPFIVKAICLSVNTCSLNSRRFGLRLRGTRLMSFWHHLWLLVHHGLAIVVV
jgi:hypothetical protein